MVADVWVDCDAAALCVDDERGAMPNLVPVETAAGYLDGVRGLRVRKPICPDNAVEQHRHPVRALVVSRRFVAVRVQRQ